MSAACHTVEDEDFDLDGEFEKDIKEARSILNEFKRPKDREYGGNLIDRVKKLNSSSVEVKANRNKFTKFLLKVLKTNKETQPKEYDNWFKTKTHEEASETSLWSKDGRTFVATKTIPGYGLLVYMAVTDMPQLGWQEYGFLSYNFT